MCVCVCVFVCVYEFQGPCIMFTCQHTAVQSSWHAWQDVVLHWRIITKPLAQLGRLHSTMQFTISVCHHNVLHVVDSPPRSDAVKSVPADVSESTAVAKAAETAPVMKDDVAVTTNGTFGFVSAACCCGVAVEAVS